MQFPFFIYILIVGIIRIIFRSLYGSRSYRKHVFEKFRQMIYDIEARQGGYVNEGIRWIEYKFPDGIQLRASYRNRPQLRLFIPHEFSKTIYLSRVPRFVFSLLRPILPRWAKLEKVPYLAGGKDVSNLENNSLIFPILERLWQSGYSIRTDSRGMTLTKILRPEDGVEISFLETIRSIREFAKFLDGPLLEIPVSAIISDSRCAYCKEEMAAETEIAHCLQCGTPHHRECFDLNSGCSVFGCTSKRREEVYQPTAELLRN